MHYVFVTVNYNGYEHTELFIQSVNSIKVQENDIVDIIVVDNFSDKKDIFKHEKLIEEYKNVLFIKSKQNLGYFGGMNLGLDKIKNKVQKTILICNNDLTFDNQFLINYKDINFASDIFLIAPNIITKEGRQQNPHVLDRVSKFEIFQNDIYFSNYYIGNLVKILFSFVKRKKEKEEKFIKNYPQRVIKRGIGACYILTENFLSKFDTLDNKVFLWGEEAVLTHQIEQYGGKTLYTPTLKIIHHESASVNTIQSKKRYQILQKSYRAYRDYL